MYDIFRNQRTLTVLLVLVAAVAATGAWAQSSDCGQGRGRGAGWDGPGDDGFGPGFHRTMMIERLGLTEEQQAAADKLREEERAENLKLRKELMRLRHELQGEIMKDEPSEKAAADLTGRIGELRTQMQQNRLAGRLAFRKLLTPEQRDLMLTAPGPGGKGLRGGRGGRGPGQGCDPRCEAGPRSGGRCRSRQAN